MSDTPERYHDYDAEAEALSGNLTLPLIQEVKPPTFVKLNERGGYVSQHAENYQAWGCCFVSLRLHPGWRQPSTKSDHGWNTLTTSVIEGLNVLDIVTADRIVAQISTDHPPVGYVPTVTFLGTRFENLRIAGTRRQSETSISTCSARSRRTMLPIRAIESFIKRIAAQRDHIQSQKNIPAAISTRYNRLPAISDRQGTIECSLVNQTEGGFPGRCFGNAIDVPNFGKIYPRDPARSSRRTSTSRLALPRRRPSR